MMPAVARPSSTHAAPHACRAMIMDEFVIAHTLGWWAKALMLRHSGMCVSKTCQSANDASRGCFLPSTGCGSAPYFSSFQSCPSRCALLRGIAGVAR